MLKPTFIKRFRAAEDGVVQQDIHLRDVLNESAKVPNNCFGRLLALILEKINPDKHLGRDFLLGGATLTAAGVASAAYRYHER
ncbi:hypothetical protein A3F65_03330 [Candidatus Saccharibacteria bacterium RIFCSPHIGHO2_12_FULL_47_16b]|nr:MAG: hypothetical protein A3F65_03330 [Candidatus Saccharibacteria bacterium RIFCSPHIGHO2_12_FULL_47_16b]